jgi:hypothetical protein
VVPRCQIGPVQIREYLTRDLDACRALYSQLVEHHREIYADPAIGGDDPAAGFDEYYALPERVATAGASKAGAGLGLSQRANRLRMAMRAPHLPRPNDPTASGRARSAWARSSILPLGSHEDPNAPPTR